MKNPGLNKSALWIDKSHMLRRHFKWLPLIGLVAVASCRTPEGHEPSPMRAPASFCNPTQEDTVRMQEILADPGRYESDHKALIREQVQIYMMASELTYRFDQMLDKKVPMADIYSSDVYLKLLALQEIRRDIRHRLELYFAIQVQKDIASNPSLDRETAIRNNVKNTQNQFHQVLRTAPDSRFSRLAHLDIHESFEDLGQYYVTCDHNALHQSFEKRLKQRQAAIKKINKLPIIENAYEALAPRTGDSGKDVGFTIQELSQSLREHLIGEPRNPQSTEMFKASAGPEGNVFGKEFPDGTWALTFDDGPAGTTSKVLDNLQMHNIKATFFMLSQQISNPNFRKVALRIRDDEHAIACHSMTHAQIPKLAQKDQEREIIGAKHVFAEVFGRDPVFFRLPYGAGLNVKPVREMIASENMIHIFWNVDTLDWHDHDPQTIFDRAVKQITQYKHGVILFHDIHPQSVIASEMLMSYFKRNPKKYRLVTIPEIVNELNGAEKKPQNLAD